MKTRPLSTLLMALSIAVPAVSMAQPPARDDHRDQGRHEDRRDDQHEDRHDDRHDDRRDDHRGAPPQAEHVAERGAGPNHDFRRGGRLSAEYRNRQYVVDDWRAHRLSAPPRGYHWVQTGPDYVLVAITTGIIAQILLSQ